MNVRLAKAVVYGVGSVMFPCLVSVGSLCDGHGICKKYEVRKGDDIQVHANALAPTGPTNDIVPGRALDLGYVGVYDPIAFHAEGSDKDLHICETGNKVAPNYIDPTPLGVEIILRRGQRRIGSVPLSMTPGPGVITAHRNWDGLWFVPVSVASRGHRLYPAWRDTHLPVYQRGGRR